MPPASAEQRFCMVLWASWSSQVQVTFMPSETFSTLKVQRGTIWYDIPVGTTPGVTIPGTPTPGTVIPVRSIRVLDILGTPFTVSLRPGIPQEETQQRGAPGGPSLGPSPVVGEL